MEHHLPANLAEANVAGLRPDKTILPRLCQACGAEACYGRGPIWGCTGCWILMGFWRRQWPTSPSAK